MKPAAPSTRSVSPTAPQPDHGTNHPTGGERAHNHDASPADTLYQHHATGHERAHNHDAQSVGPQPVRGIYQLLASHTLETWTSRSWEFAGPIWLADLVPDSLLPLSIYGVVVCLGAILAGPRIGKYVDSHTRWNAVWITVVIAKVAMVLAALLLHAWFLTVQHPDGSVASTLRGWFGPSGVQNAFLAVLCILGLVIKWSNMGYVISVERDWVVVMTNHESTVLSHTNAWIRRIDLLSKMLAPLAMAAVTTGFKPLIATLALGGFALVDMVLELILFTHVRKHHPRLSQPKETPDDSDTDPDHHIAGAESTSPILVYLRHPVLLASLAMAALYLTVLSFGGTMIAYLKTEQHLDDNIIAGARAVAAVMGVGATWLAPFLIDRVGPERAGLWSIWLQALTLAPTVVTKTVDPWLLVACVTVSRVWLWTFDLAHAQVMQDAVAAHEVGAVNGVHLAMCSVGDVLTYVLTLVWTRPDQFPIPMRISVGCVLVGAILWTAYSARVRKHLVHWERVPLLRGSRD
ncbi:hypothetical protein AMAG_07943 [Allomyces macrogynus ATCC 38327]|uniref:Solute carrier family 40 member n=1 Tax=Allomyces macrogynus (strain ATCC 38327) TaxID=578462 RepID=A0A0L0SJV0_ALLM3|nr:hypothetical protein AMAG_07943 [Allomyces macrogynus ATCC 38327]|eukprot:KNE62758.1 hypothetical protein AMAG_07943 [Allomyces macrogynus ATCC 38327]